jgi:LEA14-like dessication related protein
MDKTLRNGLIVAGLGFAGYEIHRLSQFKQSYTLIPGAVNFSLAGDTLSINTRIRFRNNSPVDVQLKTVYGQLEVAGNSIGWFELKRAALLKGNSETPIDIATSISGAKVLENIVQLAGAKKITIKYRVTVGVKAAFFFTVPLTATITQEVDFAAIGGVVDQIKNLFGKK